MPRRLLLFAALVAVFTLSVASSAPAGSAASIPSTGVWRICSGCSQHGLADASRYGYVVLHAWQSGLIAQLKAGNPNLKVLVYKDASASVEYACRAGVDDAELPAGVGYCWAGANRPDWFLTDTNGRRIEFCDYDRVWLMDVGNPDYQQTWLDAVAGEAKAKGFDGVMLDDVNQDQSVHLCGRTIAKYPRGADFTAAMTSFMARVGPGLRSRGLLAIPNIMIANYWEPGGLQTWDTWVSYSSGAVQEYYSKWRYDSAGWFTDDGGWHNDWTYRQEFLKRTQAAGKIFVGLTYAPSGDQRSMRYARASFLADWNGGPSALAFEPTTPEAQDPYHGLWATDLGLPLRPRYRVGNAWRRDFSGGSIVVNPSTSAVTVALGATFTLPDGQPVTSVTLQSADAAILRSAAQQAPQRAAPANVSPPTIRASRANRTLTATTGAWAGNPTAHAYRWQRCDARRAACAPIAGATSATYRPAPGGTGFTLRVTVTASNAAGSTSATSAPTPMLPRTRARAA